MKELNYIILIMKFHYRIKFNIVIKYNIFYAISTGEYKIVSRDLWLKFYHRKTLNFKGVIKCLIMLNY